MDGRAQAALWQTPFVMWGWYSLFLSTVSTIYCRWTHLCHVTETQWKKKQYVGFYSYIFFPSGNILHIICHRNEMNICSDWEHKFNMMCTWGGLCGWTWFCNPHHCCRYYYRPNPPLPTTKKKRLRLRQTTKHKTISVTVSQYCRLFQRCRQKQCSF